MFLIDASGGFGAQLSKDLLHFHNCPGDMDGRKQTTLERLLNGF